MSIVVVSNRVARAKSDEPMAGGLAAALMPAVKANGAIWVGSSGRQRAVAQKEALTEIQPMGAGALALVDLPEAHYRRFYEGFANSVLWPAFHSRTDLIRAGVNDYASYCEIGAFMARAVLRFQRPDSAFWIHDYHFLTLAAEMRKLGVEAPIGFFLHTSLPPWTVLTCIPHHRELMRAMLAYDLIGFQTIRDRDNFADYLTQELGLTLVGDVVVGARRRTRLAAFPIGIDVESFAARATKAVAGKDVVRLRESLQGAQLVIGVDRVDYSKGLANRFHAIDHLLRTETGLKRGISMLQIGVPSREQISTYSQLQKDLSMLVGEINGRHSEVDWVPIRYLNKSFSQSALAGFYRAAQVGLVTPLRDGMNLVAKEYVAAQNPLDPGVLVLSEFAGAAHQLDAALLVNPHDIDGMARALARALRMSMAERRERWEAMMATLRGSSVQAWYSDFVDALRDPVGIAAPSVRPTLAPVPVLASARERMAANIH